MFRAPGLPEALGRLARGLTQATRHPVFFRFTGGRRDSSRGLPFAVYPTPYGGFRGRSVWILVYQAGWTVPREDRDEVRFPLLPDVPIARLSGAPTFLDSLAARVWSSAVASPRRSGGALCGRILKEPEGTSFATALPSAGLPAGGAFRRRRGNRSALP
jgi:hypothetical protein